MSKLVEFVIKSDEIDEDVILLLSKLYVKTNRSRFSIPYLKSAIAGACKCAGVTGIRVRITEEYVYLFHYFYSLNWTGPFKFLSGDKFKKLVRSYLK